MTAKETALHLLPGHTRNTGIKESKGEYISFIDSDDYISKDFLYNLYNTAKKYDSDIVNTLNIKFDRNKKLSKFYYTFSDKEFESSWNLNDIENFYSKQAIAPYVWNKIYKTSFILENDLYFMDMKFGVEDANFTIKLMAHKPKISFNNIPIYYYRQRENSLSHSKIVKTTPISANNAIVHMTNALNYYKENYNDFLEDIYLKVFVPALNFYSASSQKTKRELYNKFYNFVQELDIEESKINKKSTFENYVFNEYLSIKISKTYDEYLFNSRFPEDHTNFYEVNKLDVDFTMPSDLTTVYRRQNRTDKWEINNLLTFKWNNDVHFLTILAGQTAEGYRYSYQESTRKGTASNSSNDWFLSSAYTGDKTYGLNREWSAVGFIHPAEPVG